ncbi:MAG TPA: peptide chain release factor-like protein [Candidatus Kapabacteria bacterium]|jgi:peptide chain release factor|nr:peptide chain release factor-like protein [Candidatus Kapabacteria bacterium]
MPKVLNEAELEEIFERSSGPGGQNVNKTSTKVMLRHIPTGISVTVQDTRSQAQNRTLARERLLQALIDRKREAEAAARQEREKTRRQKRKRPAKVKARILASKKHRGAVKRERSKRDFE